MQSIRTQSQFTVRMQFLSDSPTELLHTLFAFSPSLRNDRITPAKTKKKAMNCLNNTFIQKILVSKFDHLTTFMSGLHTPHIYRERAFQYNSPFAIFDLKMCNLSNSKIVVIWLTQKPTFSKMTWNLYGTHHFFNFFHSKEVV